MHADHELNRSSWDELAAVHGQDAYYDSEALVAGASSLMDEEESALADAGGTALTGRRILQLQCHLGFDAITFARRGARVTGLDFSPVALARAEQLARRCGVEVEWVCADAAELPDYLAGRFDLVWATMGILCWIAELDAWMRGVAAVLAPGGVMVLIDGHPGARTDAVKPVRTRLESGWDYATTTRTGPQVQYRHTLPAIVAAASAAGLRVDRLIEHTAVSHHLCIQDLRLDDDGRYRHRDDKALPVLFTLVAER